MNILMLLTIPLVLTAGFGLLLFAVGNDLKNKTLRQIGEGMAGAAVFILFAEVLAFLALLLFISVGWAEVGPNWPPA